MRPAMNRSLLLCLALTFLFTLPLDPPLDAAVKEEPVLSATVRIDIDWHDYNPGNSNIVENGSCFLQVNGPSSRATKRAPLLQAQKPERQLRL